MSKLTISPPEEAERRIDAWVLATNVEPLEADWVSLKFELKRLRQLERELSAQSSRERALVEAARDYLKGRATQNSEGKRLQAALEEYER